MEVSPTIDKIKNIYGKECGIVGIEEAGENLLPVSTLFSTYPEGEPVFIVLGAVLRCIWLQGIEGYSSEDKEAL